MSKAAIEAALLVENKRRCEPPLPERQVRKIAHSISRYAPAPVVTIPPPPSDTADRDHDPEDRTEPVPEYHPKTGKVIALAPTIGDLLLFHYNFATNDGEKLHVFRDGAYRENAHEFIRKEAQALATKWKATGQWKTGLAEEVHEWVLLKSPRLWERPPLDRVNLLNGILNVRTGKLEPHTCKWLSTIQLPVRYDKNADCPEWEK